MQNTTRLSLLGLAITVLALNTPSALGGDMKPYKGWVVFPPATGADGASYSVRHDDIGGVGLRRAETVGYSEEYDWENLTVTMTIAEEGVITYPNGDTIRDSAIIVLVFGFDGLYHGGRVDALITGGTVRFEGAYGWGKMEGWYDPPIDLANTEPFRLPFEGMISTVGSLTRE